MTNSKRTYRNSNLSGLEERQPPQGPFRMTNHPSMMICLVTNQRTSTFYTFVCTLLLTVCTLCLHLLYTCWMLFENHLYTFSKRVGHLLGKVPTNENTNQTQTNNKPKSQHNTDATKNIRNKYTQNDIRRMQKIPASRGSRGLAAPMGTL